MLKPIRNWDKALSNMDHVAGAELIPDQWLARAADYRAGDAKMDLDIPYGDQPREKFDMIWPDGTPKGLVVFIHGGYWIRLSKDHFTHLAEGARANGWAVAMPSYTLAPKARVSEITAQVAAAITKAAPLVDGPIRLAGHSVGGHLVARMICDDTRLDAAILSRIETTLAISGLFDLRPLLQVAMNETLKLDEAEAIQESPALHRPIANIPLTCWVGGIELPEFMRQSGLMATIWDGLDIETSCVVDGEHDHFTVIDALADKDSPITKAMLG